MLLRASIKKCWELIRRMRVQLKHQTACWASSSSSWSRGSSERERFQQKVKLRIKKWTQQMLVKNVLHIDRMKRVGRRPRKNLVKLKQPKEKCLSLARNAGDDVIYVIIWSCRWKSHIHGRVICLENFLISRAHGTCGQSFRIECAGKMAKKREINFLPRFTASFCIQFLIISMLSRQ